MKKLILAVTILLAAFVVFTLKYRDHLDSVNSAELEAIRNSGGATRRGGAVHTTGNTDALLADAFQNKIGNLQIEGEGVVVRIMSDDNDGSRHQRFILRLGSGQTLLMAHNIDLAPRVDSLKEGNRISFYGEYEWNAQGGVIHWTHRDPAGRHPAGWIRRDGKTYQ